MPIPRTPIPQNPPTPTASPPPPPNESPPPVQADSLPDLERCPRCGYPVQEIRWGQTNCPHCGLHFECC